MLKYEKLEIWKLYLSYAEKCYNLANKFPSVEQYVLSEQIRKATVSISYNLIEGSISSTNKGFIEYLDKSIESISETINIFKSAQKRKYIAEIEKTELIAEAEKFIEQIRLFQTSLIEK